MISIIVPTLNESKNILKFLDEIKNINFKYELIFVDDNSWDGTKNLIKKINLKNVKFIVRKSRERDLSKSVFLGVQKSIYDYVLVMDCDLQHDVKNANLMQTKIFSKKFDLVIGSRFLTTKYSGNLGFFRSLFSLSFIFIINLFFKKKTTDPLSGFFLCKKNIILENKNNYFLKGYKILFDIIYNSKQNLKIKDIQIYFRKRNGGYSKLNKRIVKIFIQQILYSLKRNYFANIK